MRYKVTPFAGVWIEIPTCLQTCLTASVTPFAGVWIEIDIIGVKWAYTTVTPFAGVWIEIIFYGHASGFDPSHPSRVCGLKYQIP